MASDLVAAAVLASVPLAWALGQLTLTHVVLAALANGACTVFFRAAYPALVRQVAPAHQQEQVFARLFGTESTMQVAGPGVGGLLAQLLGGQPHPVLRREGRGVPLRDGLGVGVPLLGALELPLQGKGLGCVRGGDGSRVVGEVGAGPPGTGVDEPPPPLTAVLGQLGRLLDQPGLGQHLEVVAGAADGLSGALRQARGGRGTVHLEGVHHA